MKLLLLSRYGSLGASSRVRYLQYLDRFRAEGVEVDVVPLFSNRYLEALYDGRRAWGEMVRGYVRRLRTLLGVGRYDLVVIEKELFPFLPAIAERVLERLGVRYVADYDDALFHRYDRHRSPLIRWLLGRKVDVVMRHAAVVVAGNRYLAARAREAGASRIEIVPTVVDIERYTPKGIETTSSHRVPVVGWIGSPSTSRYLRELLPVFADIRRQMDVRFVAVGARPGDFEGSSVEVWPWTESSEVSAIQQFDVGVMPLPDSPWERGKCGYKLIQYMACGVPVVASPVGVNVELVSPECSGYLASDDKEWLESLLSLLRSPETRGSLGQSARAFVSESYSLQTQAPRLVEILRSAADSGYSK
ncbi:MULTISPECIES: glycosyltransferase family 4 protein [unclassified Guyparkeria]|uniref:glycosyltransferase family 4 protein n=1 Tax=unclassified Guyparkeria TaxID=2626246 RepID=UPI0007336435|nr:MULTISPECIES: glycosyltransferase family 4 protein [unclassified Guyparkeria]KTG16276.1 glycosyl transferase family 1 [Guyparkeria sp. XI15]OAE85127.1 glycosyl transferase family 1 [Guyparkeria sp. WRN-7]